MVEVEESKCNPKTFKVAGRKLRIRVRRRNRVRVSISVRARVWGCAHLGPPRRVLVGPLCLALRSGSGIQIESELGEGCD